jgi:hypothetical protein
MGSLEQSSIEPDARPLEVPLEIDSLALEHDLACGRA